MKRNIEFIVVHTGQPVRTTIQQPEQEFHHHITSGGNLVKGLPAKQNSALGQRSGNECICIAVTGNEAKKKPSRSQEHTLFDLIVELTERYPSAKVVNKEHFDARQDRSLRFDVRSWLAAYVPDLAVAA